MNINERYKNAEALFESASWTDEESAMFYFEYFGEDFLVDNIRNSQDDNKEKFIELIGKYKGKNRVKKEGIEVPIYFYEKDNGKIKIDDEGIRDEFEEKLREIIKNPKKFLNV